MLLSVGRSVQPSAHLGEAPINLLEAPVDVTSQVAEVLAKLNEVLSQCIETRSVGVSEVADLGSDPGDVPVGCAGQYPGGCGVLLGCAESPIDVCRGE